MEFLPKIAGCPNFVNFDLIARGLSPLNPEAAVIEAGRLFMRKIRALISSRSDFGFETTLSGTTYLSLIRGMRREGYVIRVYYLWLPNVQLALKRISDRVRRGGHAIPEDVVKRRFGKSISNLIHVICLWPAIVPYLTTPLPTPSSYTKEPAPQSES